MALTNAQRQARFRDRQVKSGERVRFEFRVPREQAEAFLALTRHWRLSRTQTFLRLLEKAPGPDGGAGQGGAADPATSAAPQD